MYEILPWKSFQSPIFLIAASLEIFEQCQTYFFLQLFPLFFLSFFLFLFYLTLSLSFFSNCFKGTTTAMLKISYLFLKLQKLLMFA